MGYGYTPTETASMQQLGMRLQARLREPARGAHQDADRFRVARSGVRSSRFYSFVMGPRGRDRDDRCLWPSTGSRVRSLVAAPCRPRCLALLMWAVSEGGRVGRWGRLGF